MNRSLLAGATALTLTLLLGQITDKTTGQPLHGVQVTVQSRGLTRNAVTDAHGRFRVPGVRPGSVTVHYSSADIPPQSTTLSVRGAQQTVTITACSMTLDYHCDNGGGS